MSLIAMVPDSAVDQKTRDAIRQFSRSPDDIDNIYKVMLVNRPLYDAWAVFGGALFDATLPFRDREIAVLRVLCNARDDYDWTHHVGLCRDRETLDDNEVKAIAGLIPADEAGLSDHDQLLLQAIDELMAEYRIRRATLVVLKRTYNDGQVIELTQLAAFYVGIACTNNTAELPLEPHFESERTW